MWLSLDKHEEELLYDPQTSGGLLLSLPDSQAEELLAVLNDEGVHFCFEAISDKRTNLKASDFNLELNSSI